ncbi:phage tail tube protein [Cytobacillus massiliigabonensis]|uniref:phage tail tube protein n=1 Tax=Cytobacillus massiliigabonensis TaxID=1871011 RepID=UPI000C83674A|nr:phage tail tube protein [Cytobacillus massiliigabonensis]
MKEKEKNNKHFLKLDLQLFAQSMNAKDTISASLAECFVTMEGIRYNFMQAINLEASMEKTKSEVPILGKTGKGNKATGWTGSGSATFHYNTSIFRELLYRFKKTGEDIYFDIQVTNEDPTSGAGRQTVILKDCNIDGGILTKFDADAEYLDEDMDFTFDDWEIPEKFTLLSGMQ